MPRPNRTTLAWAAAVLAGEVTVDRGLREGGSPWLIHAAGNLKSAVLRVAPLANAEQVRTEVVAMRHAATARLPVPEVLGHNGGAATRFALVLTSYLAGSSQIPVELDNKQLRTLGATAARISAVDVPSPSLVTLPARTGPIEDVDWAALRRKHGALPMLRRAAEAIARAEPVDTKVGFVHGDLWHGNTLWDGTELTAILDWDAAGIGSPGIDLGSVRCDAALCYGPSAASEVLSGWEGEAGRPASDVAYWDVVAALASPPDMGWVRPAMADQGRSDLTAALLTERREAFLDQALRQLEQ